MKKIKKKRRILSFLNKYNFETFVLILFLTGIFLSTQDFDLSNFLRVTIVNSFKFSTDFIIESISNLSSQMQGFRLSNSLGAIILFLSLILIIRRVRFRLLKSSDSTKQICKICNGILIRKESTKNSKILSKILHLRLKTYRCQDCRKKVLNFKSR